MNKVLRGALSLESEEQPVDANEEKVETEVEEAVTEVVESGSEVEKAEVEQEELERAEASMEAIYTALESAGENGLSQESIAGYHLAAEVTLGGALANPVSMEGYGEDPVAATQLSLESIGEVISKIWKAIKEAVKKSIKAIGDFFKKMFSGVEKLKKRIDSQLKTVEGLKKDKAEAKEAKVKISAHEKLQWKGKFDAKTLQSGAEFVGGQVTTSVLEHARATNKMFKSTLDVFKQKAADAVGEAKSLEDEEKEIVDDLLKLQAEFPGGVKFVVEVETDIGVLTSFSIEEVKGYKGDGEIDTPNLDALEAILKTLSKLVDSLSKGKKEIEMTNRLRDDAIKAADKWAKDLEKEESEKFDQKEAKRVLKRTNSKLTNSISKKARYIFNYTRAASSAVKDVVAVYSAS